jgi:hypothetical protein
MTTPTVQENLDTTLASVQRLTIRVARELETPDQVLGALLIGATPTADALRALRIALAEERQTAVREHAALAVLRRVLAAFAAQERHAGSRVES